MYDFPLNPEAAHRMQPLGGNNIQPTTETRGAKPLAYHLDGGFKDLELTTRVV